jgi:hypothetical protein
MSLVNLVGNLLTPNYDSLYIVNSSILQEAIDDHDALIDGMVGTLVMKKDPKETVQVEDRILNRVMTVATPRTPGRKMETKEFDLKTDEVSTFSTFFFYKYRGVPRFLQLPRDRTYRQDTANPRAE